MHMRSIMTTDNIDASSFRENVIVKPFLDGKVLFHFQFVTTQETNDTVIKHYTKFPKLLGQVLDKYSVQELHLSFTQGRWQYDKWGIPLSPAPVGAELITWFQPGSNPNIEQQWKGLVNALSGLFCASLNFLDTTTEFSYAAGVVSESRSDLFRYGTLSHETVCTENLTPFKQLLPSRAKAGLAALLNPIKLYDAYFHSIGVHFRRHLLTSGGLSCYELIQTLSVVFDLDSHKRSEGDRVFKDWSLNTMFGISSPLKSFPLASESSLLLEISPELLIYFNQNAKEHNQQAMIIIPDSNLKYISDKDKLAVSGFGNSTLYEVDFMKDPIMRDVKFRWGAKNTPIPIKYPTLSPITAQRYETGYGQLEGGLVLHIQNNDVSSPITIRYYDAIPWYFKIYFYTLRIQMNGQDITNPQEYCSYFNISPSKDREKSAVIEFEITMPPQSNISISVEFDKAFLKYTEHSPDANRGFDLSSSIISYSITGSVNNSLHILFDWQPILKVANSKTPVIINTRLYTESLLITLPKPDFSMPYNVITLSSTIIALFFGSMFNLVVRRFKLDIL